MFLKKQVVLRIHLAAHQIGLICQMAVEPVGRDSYLGTKLSILENRPTEARTEKRGSANKNQYIVGNNDRCSLQQTRPSNMVEILGSGLGYFISMRRPVWADSCSPSITRMFPIASAIGRSCGFPVEMASHRLKSSAAYGFIPSTVTVSA